MPTPTNAAASGFIPAIWANRALMLFRKKIRIASRIRRDTDFGDFTKGSSLTIPYFGTLVAQDKAAGVGATTQEPTGGASVTVTLDKYKYVDIVMPDVVKAQANTALMDSYLSPMVDALAVAVEDDLFALYAQFTTVIGIAGTDITKALLFDANEALNNGSVPEEDRTIVIATKDETALLNDSTLANFFAWQKPDAITNAAVGRIGSLDVMHSVRVPVVAGTPASTKNLAFHKDAMILATRALEAPPQGSGVQASSITDIESGLTMRAMSQYSMSDRGLRLGLDMLYGVKKLRDASGVVVLS